MRTVSWLFLIFAIGLINGCKSSPFVGRWNSQSDLMGIPMTSVTENNADGTFKTVSTLQQAAGGGSITITDTGTWKLEGDKVTVLVKDIDWKVRGTSAEKAKRATDMFAARKAQIIQTANADPTKTITWKGNDEFSVTENGKTYTYRRAK